MVGKDWLRACEILIIIDMGASDFMLLFPLIVLPCHQDMK